MSNGRSDVVGPHAHSIDDLPASGIAALATLQTVYDASPAGAKVIAVAGPGDELSVIDTPVSLGVPIFRVTNNALTYDYLSVDPFGVHTHGVELLLPAAPPPVPPGTACWVYGYPNGTATVLYPAVTLGLGAGVTAYLMPLISLMPFPGVPCAPVPYIAADGELVLVDMLAAGPAPSAVQLPPLTPGYSGQKVIVKVTTPGGTSLTIFPSGPDTIEQVFVPGGGQAPVPVIVIPGAAVTGTESFTFESDAFGAWWMTAFTP